MSSIVLTQTSGFILGPISKLLGYLMNAIFTLLEKIGIPSIGLSIIIFVLIIYLLLMPLTVKQQKFAKLQAKMQPELQAIQKKYEGKKDNNSVMAMNEEQKEVYRKYGVSPSGSCIQLLIQMPILLALYRVIANFPAYVPAIKSVFTDLVDSLVTLDSKGTFMQTLSGAQNYTKQFSKEEFVAGSDFMKDLYIDVLNKASSADWDLVADKFPSISNTVKTTYETLTSYNNFLGLNIGNSPSFIVKEAFQSKSFGLIIGALLIPILAAAFQFLSVKLMPQANEKESSGNETADSMMQSMKMMNYTMPLMSAMFCFTLPAGMGIYWVSGSLIRCIQQVLINRHIDKIDFDALIEKNKEKAAQKKKREVSQSTVLRNANIRARSAIVADNGMSQSEKDALIEEAKRKNEGAVKGSLASKVNMVKDYNDYKES